MDRTETPAAPRSPLRLAALGAAVAGLWWILGMLIGLAPASASASTDEPQERGLLGAVATVAATLDDTVEILGTSLHTTLRSTTSALLGPADAAPAPAVTAPRPPAPPAGAPVPRGVAQGVAQGAVAGVAQSVPQGVAATVRHAGEAAVAIVAPVRASLEPLTAPLTPVLDALDAVPVVGDAVTALGLPDAARSLDRTLGSALGTVTNVLDLLADAVETVGDAVAPAPPILTPSTPAGPVIPGTTPLPATAGESLLPPSAERPTESPRTWPRAASAAPWGVPATMLAAGPPRSTSDLLRTAWPGSSMPAEGSTASSSPSGTGMAAVAVAPLVCVHRAWARRRAGADGRVPASRSGSPDVSPD